MYTEDLAALERAAAGAKMPPPVAAGQATQAAQAAPATQPTQVAGS
jgi:hypothetical protein